ncbi:MAG: hypothetical protein H8F28_10135 [Fibrella sp.]|nr:hypothetical protein [Armatimonadota bacterium]
MRLRQNEVEATDVHGTSTPGTAAALGYDQVELKSATPSTAYRGDLTAKAESEVSRFAPREAFRVTVCMLLLASLSHTITRYLTYAMAGMLMPFPVGSETIPGMISFVVMAIHVAAFGIGVGLLANRRTMVASVVVANTLGLLVTGLAIAYIYAVVPPEAWTTSTFSTFGILFKAVTITFTEVAVALYVARTFRKKP